MGGGFQAAPVVRGDKAPAIEGTTPDGQAISDRWGQGDATVVAFFATWCKPCHLALRDLLAIQRATGPRLRFILIEAGDDPGEVRQFLAENPVPEGAVVATDPSGEVRQRWGCVAYPTLFIVDRAGTVRYVNRGWGEGSAAKYVRRVRDVLGNAAAGRSSIAPRPGPQIK